jgi:membrane fusion protein (multidrug efflux system)
VAARVSGQINSVLVAENQSVRQGETLFTIDEQSYAIAVKQAEAIFGSAQAAHDILEQQLIQQDSIIAQAKANVDAGQAAVELSRYEHNRYRNLAADGSGSKQAYQQASADYKIAQANLQHRKASYQSQVQQKSILQMELDKARANMLEAQAALDTARLNLSYCKVVAPINGVVSQQRARLGAYVQIGAAQLAIVPLADIYIDAYYRETQMANIRPGQSVTIKIDALPGRQFQGRVLSQGPASNASFSSVAPHSESSNFTKIVQRLPLRIAITDENRELLKVGMSVIPEIDTGQ